MSAQKSNINIKNPYCKYNRIRTKLLLFTDNEVQSKIKQSNQNLKFSCETEIRISFEETFTQKKNDKFNFTSSNILKPKKNDNFDKSLSTNDVSPNKISKKSQRKGKDNIHSKTPYKKDTRPDKLSNNNIYFNKKFYSIKNLSKQSSTFLILPKQKNAAQYLKTLCNNLKKCKNNKKPVKYLRSISINNNYFCLNKDKKSFQKFNEVKTYKSKKDNAYGFCLFRKPQKGNFVINSTHRINGKSINPVLMTIKQKE